eukprot:288275-Rhodomonas_salina.1
MVLGVAAGPTAVGVAPAAPLPVGENGTVVRVALGSAHACALFDDALVRCWGLVERLGIGHAASPANATSVGAAGDRCTPSTSALAPACSTSPPPAPSHARSSLPRRAATPSSSAGAARSTDTWAARSTPPTA